jgi:deazaflavin-dependent oxidoreductase (nitroreductase family)
MLLTSATSGAQDGAMTTTTDRYVAPGRITRRAMNPVVSGLTRLGLSVWGSRVLAVRGRTSGEWRTTPVNLLELDGERYLVAPRGQTQWVRNLRVAGGGELRLGRRTEVFRAEELRDDEKGPVLREYLRRWKAEVGAFFDDPEHIDPAGFPAFRLL